MFEYLLSKSEEEAQLQVTGNIWQVDLFFYLTKNSIVPSRRDAREGIMISSNDMKSKGGYHGLDFFITNFSNLREGIMIFADFINVADVWLILLCFITVGPLALISSLLAR